MKQYNDENKSCHVYFFNVFIIQMSFTLNLNDMMKVTF